MMLIAPEGALNSWGSSSMLVARMNPLDRRDSTVPAACRVLAETVRLILAHLPELVHLEYSVSRPTLLNG